MAPAGRDRRPQPAGPERPPSSHLALVALTLLTTAGILVWTPWERWTVWAWTVVLGAALVVWLAVRAAARFLDMARRPRRPWRTFMAVVGGLAVATSCVMAAGLVQLEDRSQARTLFLALSAEMVLGVAMLRLAYARTA